MLQEDTTSPFVLYFGTTIITVVTLAAYLIIFVLAIVLLKKMKQNPLSPQMYSFVAHPLLLYFVLVSISSMEKNILLIFKCNFLSWCPSFWILW